MSRRDLLSNTTTAEYEQGIYGPYFRVYQELLPALFYYRY